MAVAVLRGDARHLPLPDGSVDLIVTSPPYFGLRSYTDGGEHYAGQIGSEATPAEFVAALLDCTREWVRVLKPSGSLFVNLGDKYHGKQPGDYSRDTQPLRDSPRSNQSHRLTAQSQRGARRVSWGDAAPKSLLGLPWRYALGCIDQLGLILRAEIVWNKPNGLPESVTDRVRRSHEQVFHFTRLPRYFAAVDEIREPYHREAGPLPLIRKGPAYSASRNPLLQGDRPQAANPLGKLPGSVWTIPSSPLKVPDHLGIDHFAAFPPALVRPIVLGWSPAGICTRCGEGRRPVVSATRIGSGRMWDESGRGVVDRLPRTHDERTDRQHLGYACACTPYPEYVGGWAPPPTRPAVVLDPFGGTGTTALVASVYGRHAVTVDMSADYCRLAQWRTQDPAERARAMDVPKPPPIPDGQDALFA